MSKILITGAKGQLGRSLLDAISHFPTHQVIGFDINELDILDMKAVYDKAKAFGAEVLINCAAYTNVDKAEEDSDIAYAVNDKAVGGLTMVCNRLGMVLIHLSTDYVFDGKATKPYKEEDIARPLSVYGASKLGGEQHVLSYRRGLVVRTSWLYSSSGNNFLSAILRLSGEQEVIKVVNDQTGTPTCARHLAEVLLQIAREIEISYAPESLMGLYHFANSGSCTWFAFAQKIKEVAQLHTRMVPIPSSEYPTPAKRPPYSVLDTQRITKIFGIVPPHWEDGLKTYFI